MRKKLFFVRHTKSSAALISLGMHAVLIVVALSFVAVTVITKDDQKFEAKKVNRPKMQLKKLQVPVNIKKMKTQKPKMRKQIVVKPKHNQQMPDIKMPEVTGVKGGFGAAGAGLGAATGIGFSIPEINVFGIKGKGEKVFIALDSDARIMRDEIGGMQAYTIIKEELLDIVGDLPSTVLFNVAVFEHNKAFVLFPSMVSATSQNVARLKEWIEPLNQVKKGMTEDAYGVKTLAFEGLSIQKNEYQFGSVEDGRHWYLPAALAMAEQADSIFILTGWWGVQDHKTDEKSGGWSESEIEKWNEKLEKAKAMLMEENKKRLAKGEPPRVLRDNKALVNAYFPGSGHPPRQFRQYSYTANDFANALQLCRKDRRAGISGQSNFSKRKLKDNLSLNIIYFSPVGEGIAEREEERFRQLTSMCNGELRVLEGLEAIQSSVSGEQ